MRLPSIKRRTRVLDLDPQLDWYTRQDLNLRPLAPQANALSS
jgi:hypothetical protein